MLNWILNDAYIDSSDRHRVPVESTFKTPKADTTIGAEESTVERLEERRGLERRLGWIQKGSTVKVRHWGASGQMELVGGTRTLLAAGRR